jgi:hypothetical protein
LAVLGGFVPNLPEYDAFVGQKYPDVAARPVFVEIVTFLGAIGGGMYDYIGYTGLLREKKWGVLGHREVDAIEDRIASLGPGERIPLSERPEDLRNAQSWIRAPLGDTAISFAAIAVFTLAFMINGANILNRQERVPEDEEILTVQSEFLAVVAPIFEYFYVVAIILVFFGVLYAIWEVYTETTYESFAAVSERMRRAGTRSFRPWVYLYVGIAGILLVLTGLDIVALVTPSTIVGGTLAGGIYCAGLLYADRVALPPQYRLGGVGRALLIVATLFMTFVGLVALLDYLGISPW